MSYSANEMRDMLNAGGFNITDDADILKLSADLQNMFQDDNYYFKPSKGLLSKIDHFESLLDTGEIDKLSNKEKGELMEELSLLVFNDLRLANLFSSYVSFSSQLDLVVSSNNLVGWKIFLNNIGISSGTNILVEAKNTKASISASVFSRLCSILFLHFSGTAQLGIFFSRQKPSGFPNHGRPIRNLSNAQADQIIFYAKTGKLVIYFDRHDIFALREQGSFVRLLREKIQTVEQWTGKVASNPEEEINLEEINLPDHLAALLNDNT